MVCAKTIFFSIQVNVFVPLCNITESNGGTEMIPKTHIFGDYDAANESTTIQADAGCVLWRFRFIFPRALRMPSPTPCVLLKAPF